MRPPSNLVASPAVPVPDLLKELLTTPGPSGHEAEAAAAFRRAAEGFAEVSSDPLGSVLARVKGPADGPSLALVGHIDEIGVAVTHAGRCRTASRFRQADRFLHRTDTARPRTDPSALWSVNASAVFVHVNPKRSEEARR